MVNVNYWTESERRIVKEFYPKGDLKTIVFYTGRSQGVIRQFASVNNFKISSECRSKNISKSRRLKTIARFPFVASVIEEYVNNPDISHKEIKDKFGISYSIFSRMASKWFPYKGDNSVVLVLSSKV